MKMAKPVSILMALVLCLALLPVAPARAETDSKALLTAIDLMARQGWILNSSYRVESDTDEDVTKDLGEPDSSDYVAAAKGRYATYDQAHIVVGYNKGEQIFELRSFDERLGAIKLNDVKAFYGKPDHTASGNGEQYLSYKLDEELNIKFVFSSSGKNPKLKHYNVLWPQGTVNMMADDPGRTW
jgi:hypothetical protein